MRCAVLLCLLSGCLGPALFVDKAGDGEGTVTSEPTGIECGDTCGALMTGPVVLTARPAVDSLFAGWEGACSGMEPCMLDVSTDLEVRARFEPRFETIRTRVIDGRGRIGATEVGISCADDCTTIVRHGKQIALRAIPDPGHVFVEWTDACSGRVDGECPLTMNESYEVGARFVPRPTLTVNVVGSGKVTSSPGNISCGTVPTQLCSTAFDPGTIVTLTATTSVQNIFAGWTGACTGADTCIVTMDQVRDVTATFTPDPCTVTVTASESAAAFNTRMAWGATICIADGVTITGRVVITADQLTIKAATPSAIARIINTTGDAIDASGTVGVVLERLDVETTGSDLKAAIATNGGSIEIRDSTLRCSGHNCYVVRAQQTSAITIKRSTLLGGVTTQSFSYGLYGYYAGVIRLEDSTLRSYGATVATTTTHVIVTNSTLESVHPYVSGTTVAALIVNTASVFELSGSTVTTYGLDALRATAQTNFNPPLLTLNGNTFRKAAGSSAGSYSPLISGREDIPFYSSVPNTFCNEGSSTTDGEFALPLISGAIAASSTWNDVTHVGPGTCP